MKKKNIYEIINLVKENFNIKDKIFLNELIEEFFNYKISIEGLLYYITNEIDYEKLNDIEFLNELVYSKNEIVFENIEPLISIIIPTYNRRIFLEEAIESILKQNYKNIEIIIIDDRSTDNTENFILNKYKCNENIFYHKNKTNKGPGYNRLKGYKLSKGEYIIFLDDDDFYIDNNYFRKAISMHQEYKNLAFVAANTLIKFEINKTFKINKLNLPKILNKKDYLLNFQSEKYPKPSSTFTALFNKEILESVNLTEMKMVNDTTIYLRALIGGNAGFIDNIVGVYRIHNNNISFNCSSDFIFENINEKYYIYNLATEKLDFNRLDMDDWLNKQTMITLDYYISQSKVHLKDYIKIYKWINNNIQYKKLNFTINIVKRMIKNN